MTLNIDTSGVQSKPVLNLEKSLRKIFRPGSQNDIAGAVLLACYLYFLGESKAAIQLLQSFLYFRYKDEPESQRHLWVDNCKGMLLLAYIQGREGLNRINIDLDYIMGEDSTINPTKFMKDELKHYLESNSKILNCTQAETPKYKCQTYAQQVLRFVSVVVLWPYFSSKNHTHIGFHKVELTTVKTILNENISLLQQALKGRS